MNAKKAKAIRRLLKNVVDGKIAKGEVVKEDGYVEVQKNRKYALIPTALGKEEHKLIAPGTILVSNDSIRGVYLELKKGVERAEKKHRA